MQQTEAYDLNTFAARAPRRRAPLHVAPPVKKKRGLARFNLKAVRVVLVSTLFLGLVCSVLYSQSQVTVLTGNIAKQQQQLVDLQSEYTYLTNEMEMKTSLDSVADYASTKLGLVKLDRSQIVYVQRSPEARIVRKAGFFENLLDTLKQGGLSFMEYLAP